MRFRQLFAVTGSTLLLAALSSCSASPPTACSAVGYLNSIRVHVSGQTSRVANVGFCGGATCTPRRAGVVHAGSSSTPTLMFPATHDGDIWSVPIGFARPRIGHVGAFDTGGSIIADARVHLVWRNEGTETCPGPYETSASLVVEG